MDANQQVITYQLNIEVVFLEEGEVVLLFVDVDCSVVQDLVHWDYSLCQVV